MSIGSEVHEYCRRGVNRHKQGDLDGAIAEFGRAIASQPDWAEAWNNRGVVRHARGDSAHALADFNRAIELAPGYAEAWNNRGFVQHALGDYRGALNDLNRAIELAPGYAQALGNRAITRRAIGDLDGAIADLDRALEIQPGHPEFLNARGSARHARDDLDAALADFSRLLALVPDEVAPVVYHSRGAVHFSRHDFTAAVADFTRAIALDPSFCLAYVSRGNTRYHLRDLSGYEDYVVAFRLNRELAASDIIRFLRADLRQNAEAVLENCRKHVRICPNDLVAYARRGLSLLLLGREEEARENFEEIARRNTDPNWKQHLELLIDSARRSDSTLYPPC
jgi:tetratricopeptide (TPR) repeat protein